MIELGKPRAASAALRGKIRQIGEGMTRLNEHLEVIRIEAARSRGLARIRLRRLERRTRAQVARAGATLRDCGSRLGRVPAVAKTRGAVERRVAGARVKLQDSLDRFGGTLAQSTMGARREIGLLRRGLEAGLRAGTEAYRHKRREK